MVRFVVILIAMAGKHTSPKLLVWLRTKLYPVSSALEVALVAKKRDLSSWLEFVPLQPQS